MVDGGVVVVPPTKQDASAPFCDPSDLLEIEPNDVSPNGIKPGETVCGHVEGSDVDGFSFDVPDDARIWATGLETDPDLSTNPPINLVIDGVPQQIGRLARVDSGHHVAQLSTATGTPIAYRFQVVVAGSR